MYIIKERNFVILTAEKHRWRRKPAAPWPDTRLNLRNLILNQGSFNPLTEIDDPNPRLTLNRLVKRLYCIALPALTAVLTVFPGCSGERVSRPTITWITERRDLTLNIKSGGSISAKNSNILNMPRVYQRPEITFLALEGSFVHKGDVVVELNKESFLRDLENALKDLEIARGELEAIKAQQAGERSKLEGEIEIAEQSANSARLQLVRIEFAAPREREISKLEIERAETLAAKNRKKFELMVAEQREALIQQNMKIRQVESRAELSRSHLAQLTMTSPVDGYVIYERNRSTDEKVKEGDLLHPGWSIVRIPDMSALQVTLELSETDVQQVKEGELVKITVPSLGYVVVPGKVAQIAKVAKEVKRNSRVKTVEVKVDIDSTVVGLVPGLSAECEIEARRVEDAVVVPLDAVFAKDSLDWVYFIEGENYQRRQVFIGWRGKDFAVVDSGLTGGEKLVLSEPDAKFVVN